MCYSGLAILDALTLETTEIQRDEANGIYRLVTFRQKTGTHVSVPIPPAVAKELLEVPKVNPKYVFWSGKESEETIRFSWARYEELGHRLSMMPTRNSLPNFSSRVPVVSQWSHQRLMARCSETLAPITRPESNDLQGRWHLLLSVDGGFQELGAAIASNRKARNHEKVHRPNSGGLSFRR